MRTLVPPAWSAHAASERPAPFRPLRAAAHRSPVAAATAFSRVGSGAQLAPRQRAPGGASSRGRRAPPGIRAAPQDAPHAPEPPTPEEVKLGRLTLAAVGASYGSLAASLRYVFLLPVRGVMAAVCFVPLVWSSRAALPTMPRAFWLAAGELALWNFLSQGLLNVALLYTDAMRVSFIAQTAIVLTPLIAASRGQATPPQTWVGCLVALLGVALLACDAPSGAVGAAAAAAAAAAGGGGVSPGDLLALGGAACSSLYIFRIGEMGKRGLSTDLTQGVKVIMLAFLYCLWAAADGARLVAMGGTWAALWPGCASGLAWAVLLYSAIVPGALADVLQARGQAKVGAAEAQVLLGAEPLWTALLGTALLGERLGLPGAAGAALIIAAVLLASGVGGGGGGGAAGAAQEEEGSKPSKAGA